MRVFLRHCRHGLVKKFLGGPRFRPLPGSRLADRQRHSKYLPILLQRLEATPPCSASNSPAEEYQRICFFLFFVLKRRTNATASSPVSFLSPAFLRRSISASNSRICRITSL